MQRDRPLPSINPDPDPDVLETKRSLRPADAVPDSGRGLYPILVALAGPTFGETYRVKRGEETVLGRARDVTVRIDDEAISRRHARIVDVGGALHIEDLASANGTHVNGVTLSTPRPLHEGDRIFLGATTILKFTWSDDIDEAFQRKMFEAALRDGMTKTYNKRYLLERLHRELAYSQRHGTSLSLLMIDLDHFKAVNDRYGHPAGDEVLIAVASSLQRTLRKEDVLVRYGGEEFAILCRGIGAVNAGILAERLKRGLAESWPRGEGAIKVTVSIGIASYPDVAAQEADDLIAAADKALYAAKHAGRDRAIVYEE